MRYMLLIHQGDTPLPGSPEWDGLSADEQGAVYANYKALNETPGVSATPIAARGRWPQTTPSGACSSGGWRSSPRASRTRRRQRPGPRFQP